jgi:S-adenosylmethionine:tRNA ribosyltransferase-isomerase
MSALPSEPMFPAGDIDSEVSAPRTGRFLLPAGREAQEPPEHRGLRRDQVRLLVGRPGSLRHRQFLDLGTELCPGDVLVINTSATLPAALAGETRHPDGNRRAIPVHVSALLSLTDWVVEPRLADGTGPDLRLRGGDTIDLPDGLKVRLLTTFPDGRAEKGRLWRVRLSRPLDAVPYLHQHGRPIAYSYLTGDFPLTDRQSVFSRDEGSAEMPSAGRPFTADLLVQLVAAGITVVPILLHTGVSSAEAHEPPAPEPFIVSPDAARLLNSARRAGRHVVAVGTTAVRAVESCADVDGVVHPGSGWTDLVLSPQRPARVITGLISGLHPPEASHLDLLDAVVGAGVVDRVYRAAVEASYRWHEFGDATLLLRDLADETGPAGENGARVRSLCLDATDGGSGRMGRWDG